LPRDHHIAIAADAVGGRIHERQPDAVGFNAGRGHTEEEPLICRLFEDFDLPIEINQAKYNVMSYAVVVCAECARSTSTQGGTTASMTLPLSCPAGYRLGALHVTLTVSRLGGDGFGGVDGHAVRFVYRAPASWNQCPASDHTIQA